MAARAHPPIRLAWALLLALAVALGLLAGLDPRYALAAAIALAFVAVVIANLSVGICLFAVVSFLDVLPFGGGAASFSKIAGLLLLVSWLAFLGTQQASRRDFVSAHPLVTYLLLLFLAWAAASMLWAEDAGSTLSDVQRYAPNVLLFLIVFTAVRERKHAIWVCASFVFGVAVIAVWGLVNPQPEAGNDLARLSGAGVNPGQMAAVGVAGMILAVPFVLEWRRSPGVRLLAGGAAVLALASVLLTLSRGGLVALGVALLAAVLVGGRWRIATLILLVLVVAGVVGYFTTIATPQERARVTQADGGTGRTDIWAVGLRMFSAHPLRGVGAGNFQVTSIHYLVKPGALKRDEFIIDEPKVAHNIYLQEAAELGIPGFVMFMAIVLFSVACALRAAWRFREAEDRQMELLARAVFLGVVGLMAAYFFLSEQFSKQLWLLLALGPALLAIAQAQLEATRSSAE